MSSMCLGTVLLYGGLRKNFTYFLRVARAVRLEFGLYFHEPFVSGSHLHLCVATVHGGFRTNFFDFPREKWTPSSPRSSHLGNLNIISAASGSGRNFPYLRQSMLLLEEFDIFSS